MWWVEVDFWLEFSKDEFQAACGSGTCWGKSQREQGSSPLVSISFNLSRASIWKPESDNRVRRPLKGPDKRKRWSTKKHFSQSKTMREVSLLGSLCKCFALNKKCLTDRNLYVNWVCVRTAAEHELEVCNNEVLHVWSEKIDLYSGKDCCKVSYFVENILKNQPVNTVICNDRIG